MKTITEVIENTGRERSTAGASVIAVAGLMLLIFACRSSKQADLSGAKVPDDRTDRRMADPRVGDWPSFRGAHACGVADGQNLPDRWNGETGENIRWKVPIDGLAHSSPIVWGDKLFVTSAISGRADAGLRVGLYGSGDASEDHSVHRWVVLCLDKRDGSILWRQTAHQGVPRSKRHIKATYANCTPVTDGRYVIAHFGAEGLYAYDMDGHFLWKKDLGRMDVGAYDAPDYEWGPASSPVIFRNTVIVQCDTQDESFVLACDLSTGRTVWKTDRDELPSWGTPTIYSGPGRPELVVNGSNHIFGYDPATGSELWRLAGSSKITAPTPVFADDLILVCSGRGPEKPIFAIRAGAKGDISLAEGEKSNEWIAWSVTRRGPYMPTPIIYDGLVYVCQNPGILSCYGLADGDVKYRKRIKHRGAGFSASPVAADGKIYFPSEDGDIFVIRAGPKYEALATNDMAEVVMATPALSDGTMYVRGQYHLFAISR